MVSKRQCYNLHSFASLYTTSPLSHYSVTRMVALDLNIALVIHGGFEGIVGLLLLITPQYVFPYIARRASYNNSERSLLRWFAFSIIVQAMVAFAAVVKLDARAKRLILSAFLMYHLVIVADASYGYYLEGTMDEAATGLHAIMVFVVGFLLAAGEKRARRSPRKTR